MNEGNRKGTWAKGRGWLLVLPVLLVIAVAVASLSDSSNLPDLTSLQPGTVVGEIEGQEFTRERFETEVRLSEVKYTLQDQTDRTVNRPELLNRIIGDILLMHSATEADVQVEQGEVQDEIDAILYRIGITRREMARALSDHKVAWNTFETSVREYLILSRFVDDVLLRDVPAREREAYLEDWMAERYREADIYFEQDFLDEVNS